jgi:8-oxo-dGTP pyrophosphatase MutT (NUDIX family)
MTVEEKEKIKTMTFDSLWKEIWGSTSSLSMQYKSELYSSRDKFQLLKNGGGGGGDTSPSHYLVLQQRRYNLEILVKESENFDQWEEPEWGFPKGRRNYQETDFECALREFNEETGFDTKLLKPIQNILPFEETFTGSNYKSYKHKYYLSFIDYDKTFDMDNYERSEVSKMEWKSFDECIHTIREYNLEKIRMIQTIDKCLNTYRILFF